MKPLRSAALLQEAERVAEAGSFERNLRTGQAEYSEGFRRIFGAPPEAKLSDRELARRVHPDDLELIQKSISGARCDEPFNLELRVRRFDDVKRILRTRGKVELDDAGEPARLIGSIQDVTDEVDARSARELLGYVVDSSEDAIITAAGDGTITSWNHGATQLYGHGAEEAIGRQIELLESAGGSGEQREILRSVFAGHPIARIERHLVGKDGGELAVSMSVSPVRDSDGRIVSAAIIARDVTERRRYEERLRRLADHDQLTGLFNRRRFEEELKRELARSGRYHSPGAVLVLDLDSFKSINDSAGHAAGDAVLTEVGHLLASRFRASDVVARLGGDEFAALLPTTDVREARAAADDLLSAIHNCRPVFGDKPFRITASIGVAVFESDDATAGEMMVNADLAMYAAKTTGRDRVVVYTPSEGRTARATAKLTWAERIRQALDREDGFVLHMQPILDLSTGAVSHGELLLRMRDEAGGLIAPGAFLPAAERFGLIHAIDRWVVRRAIQMLAASRTAPMPAVGVNLSGESVVGDPQLLRVIARELTRASVDPAKLIFEVTETAAIANMREASAFARGVNALGASLALDDFGTGFGSFYYLKHLPVDYVKLDGEFIQNLAHSEVDAHMVAAIVGVARGLGIKTVAESVADEETIRVLRSHQVDYAQGFHVGKPEPVKIN